jgi:outer membrane receptor protein involved in Fe transport
VGLYHTSARSRLETIREDQGTQTSAALYGESSMQWLPHLRTIAGARVDRYRFAVGAATNDTIVSPKLSIIGGPWRNTEVYANAGRGFHSNDARGVRVGTPLVRTVGAELGLRTTVVAGLHATAALWALDIDSELVFVGDAGTTEAGRPSRRTGVELAATYGIRDWLVLDGQYAYSRARFRDDDPAGNRVPGAVEGVATAGISIRDLHRFSGELRYRWFGPRPLVDDDSVRSEASGLMSARVGYALSPRLRFDVDVFNLLDAQASDIDYFYTSRLPGETVAVDDVHFHPVEKRSVRIGVTTTF